MSIPAKQIRTGTFAATAVGRAPFGAGLLDLATANSVIAAAAIAGSKIANGGVTATQLAAAAFGNGLTGGGGTAVSVEPNVTDGGGVPGLEVAANGLRLAAPAASSGLAGGAGSALAVDPDTGIVVGAGGVGFDVSANLTMTGVHSHTPTTLQVAGVPSGGNDGVNKAYVDSVGAGVDTKEAVEVATTAALPTVVAAGSQVGKTLTASAVGILTLDGQAVSLGDRVLVKDQVAPVDNGIYECTTEGTAGVAFVLTRATDADGNPAGEVSGGMFVFIKTGTLLTNTGWALYGITGTVDVDTDPQTFTQFQGLSTLTGGDGIDITTTVVSVDLAAANPGLEIAGAKLRTSAQGNGIAGGAGSLLSVNPDSTTGANTQPVSVAANGVGLDVAAIAGTGIEADGSANLRLAAQGNGIAGGAGSTLSVDSDTETGGNIQGVNLTANGVGLDVSAIAGTNLEADGSANLRIAAAAAGAGLTGGGASALAVGAGNGITVAANDVAVNPAQLVSGGNAEVDGDTLDIDWVPANYTRDAGPAEVTTVVQLTAHLKGIDNAILAAGGTPRQEAVLPQNITGADSDLADTLNNTPTSAASVKLYLNGLLVPQGAGLYYTVLASTIKWLASSGTAVDLDTSDELLAVYES
jgi:hypothetical protein